MMVFHAKVAVVLAVVAVALGACSADDGIIPPCTPLEGLEVNPCREGIGPFRLGTGHSDRSSAPSPVSAMLGEAPDDAWVTHIVVRATFLPNTGRCTLGDVDRTAGHLDGFASGEPAVKCYMDVRANEYYVADGPEVVTVLLFREGYSAGDPPPEEFSRYMEELLNGSEGLAGVEVVIFLGPDIDVSSQVLALLGYWDMRKNADGTVTAIHPESHLWEGADRQRHIALLEMSLPDLDTALDTAQAARVAKFGGRIGAAEDLPMLITDAGNLRDYFEAVGAYDHPDGPPVLPPPVRER